MQKPSKTIEEIAKKCGVVLPKNSDYDYALHTCYKCGEQMIVFEWGDSGMWEEEEPPEPIPKTVQKRYTKTAEGTYWANVCPFCDSVQGDWYLKKEPGGAFSGIPDYDHFVVKPPEKQEVDEIEEKEPEQKSLL